MTNESAHSSDRHLPCQPVAIGTSHRYLEARSAIAMLSYSVFGLHRWGASPTIQSEGEDNAG